MQTYDISWWPQIQNNNESYTYAEVKPNIGMGMEPTVIYKLKQTADQHVIYIIDNNLPT